MLLEQFLQTTNEIQYLCADKRTQEEDKSRLSSYLGQEINEVNLRHRQQALDEINSTLAQEIIVNSSPTALCAKGFGLTRISENLMDFIKANSQTLEAIDLSDNNLSTVPMLSASFPHLLAINLRENRLKEADCEEMKRRINVNSVHFKPQKYNYEELEIIPLNDRDDDTYVPSQTSRSATTPAAVSSAPPPSKPAPRKREDGSCNLM
jgi:hypothetical protein